MGNNSEQLESKWSIQDYLSLGYLYLLTLGMVKNIIFYGFLEVNILRYSSILDVLLSPFIELGRDPRIFAGFVLGFVMMYYTIKYQEKKQKKKEQTDGVKPKGKKVNTIEAFLFFSALMIFGFFIGNGLGGGYKASQKIKEGSYKTDHRLTFMDGEKIAVRLLDSNSQYIFYVVEKGKEITIAPISGNIKKIEKLTKDYSK